MEPEIWAQLRACKYAIVRNRVTASPVVRSAHRGPKQRGAMRYVAPFESRLRAMEV